jgi:DnaJ-class molecular chaperone
MSMFYWDFCPICNATGFVRTQRFGPSTTSAPTYVIIPCEACDGSGRVKVPNGCEMRAKPTSSCSITVAHSTTIHAAAAPPASGETGGTG